MRLDRDEVYWADVVSEPTCGLTASGELQCVDWDGELLDYWGNPEVFPEADRLPPDVQFVDLAMDLYNRICLLSSGGQIVCGNGPYAWEPDPLQPPQPPGTPDVFVGRSDWVDVDAAMGTVCAVSDQAEVVCAGDNRFLRADPSTMRGKDPPVVLEDDDGGDDAPG